MSAAQSPQQPQRAANRAAHSMVNALMDEVQVRREVEQSEQRLAAAVGCTYLILWGGTT